MALFLKDQRGHASHTGPVKLKDQQPLGINRRAASGPRISSPSRPRRFGVLLKVSMQGTYNTEVITVMDPAALTGVQLFRAAARYPPPVGLGTWPQVILENRV